MTSRKQMSARMCLAEIMYKEGAASLYKGLSQPIIGAAPINSLIFIGNQFFKKHIEENYPNLDHQQTLLASGALSSMCTLSVFVPLEVLKIKA